MSNNLKILLVGTGYMGREYCKVLKEQNYIPVVIGRGHENAQIFEQEMKVPVISGGVECAIDKIRYIPELAIVAANVDQLADITQVLLEHGVKRILVEKPGDLKEDKIIALNQKVKSNKAHIYIAYNRRYYASTEKALEIINNDGGVVSFNFEFTEWSSVIEKTKHSAEVKENLLFCNSSHVIDLAFFLGGTPVEMTSYIGGENRLCWHSRCSKYAGAGITNKKALFSYQANWDAPGRWSLEVLTRNHRLYFKPMEELSIQERGSVEVKAVEIDDYLDKKFKPGLYKQVEAFMEQVPDSKLLTLEEQVQHLEFYKKIECM